MFNSDFVLSLEEHSPRKIIMKIKVNKIIDCKNGKKFLRMI